MTHQRKWRPHQKHQVPPKTITALHQPSPNEQAQGLGDRLVQEVPGKFLGIIGQDPSDSKSYRLVTYWHLPVLMLSFIWGIFYRFLSNEMNGKFPESWASTDYLSNSTGSPATNRRFVPNIGPRIVSREPKTETKTQKWRASLFVRDVAFIPSQWLGRFLGIISWDPSVCQSNWLHVHILRFSFINLAYIL